MNKVLRKKAEEYIKSQLHKGLQHSNLNNELSTIFHELQVYQAELEVQNEQLLETNLALEHSHQEYQKLLDNTPLGLLLVNPNGIIENANQTAYQILGDKKIEQKLLARLIHPADITFFQVKWRQLRNSDPNQSHFIECKLKNNPDTWVRIVIGNFSFDSTTERDHENISVVIHDVTELKASEAERKDIEEQLFHAQKMEAIGQLAGGVAHDFNNHLQVLRGYTELLEKHLEKDAKTKKYLSKIDSAIDHSSTLVDQLLSFSRKGYTTKSPQNVAALFRDISDIIERTFPPGIQCQINSKPQCLVMSDPNRLHNGLLNLCINARDAIDRDGTITLSCHSEAYQQDWMSRFGLVRPAGDYVHISITDNGCGIEEKLLNKVVEPFFTTKTNNKGTGLGLSAVYGLTDALNGDLRIFSHKGRGTTVTMVLPLYTETGYEAASELRLKSITDTHRFQKSNKWILLVDDDRQVLELHQEILQDMGLQVSTVDNGAEAVEAVRREPEIYQAIILDLLMPRMNGIEAAELIRKQGATVPIILVTGYGTDEQLAAAKKLNIKYVLRKPFQAKDLQQALVHLGI